MATVIAIVILARCYVYVMKTKCAISGHGVVSYKVGIEEGGFSTFHSGLVRKREDSTYIHTNMM